MLMPNLSNINVISGIKETSISMNFYVTEDLFIIPSNVPFVYFKLTVFKKFFYIYVNKLLSMINSIEAVDF